MNWRIIKTRSSLHLRNYDIEIQKISATVGPTVTLYEIVPAAGVRISRIKNLEDDIALSLAALVSVSLRLSRERNNRYRSAQCEKDRCEHEDIAGFRKIPAQ